MKTDQASFSYAYASCLYTCSY